MKNKLHVISQLQSITIKLQLIILINYYKIKKLLQNMFLKMQKISKLEIISS